MVLAALRPGMPHLTCVREKYYDAYYAIPPCLSLAQCSGRRSTVHATGQGRVAEKNGQGLEGLLVSLYDKDLLFDDRLGETLTDASGDFTLVYRTEDFRDLFESKPDIFLKVSDKDGKMKLQGWGKLKNTLDSFFAFTNTIPASLIVNCHSK